MSKSHGKRCCGCWTSATAVDGHTLSGSYSFAYQKPALPDEPLWSKLGFRLAMVRLGIILGLWFLRRR